MSVFLVAKPASDEEVGKQKKDSLDCLHTIKDLLSPQS